MKRLELVLNQYTFLDIGYLWRLFRRYYLTSILIVVVIFSTAYHRYSLQRDIYHITVNFKMRDDESSSPTSAIASLLGEKTSRVNHNFVLTITKSTNFMNRLAKEVRLHPDFYKLNLNFLTAKKLQSTEEMIKFCKNDKNCEYKIIRDRLRGIFSINEDEIISNWYHLNIKTLSSNTTMILAKIITKTIKSHRKEVIQEHLSNQILTTEELIKNKKSQMKTFNIESEVLEVQRLKSQIELVSKNVKSYTEEVTRLLIELVGTEKIYQDNQAELENTPDNKDVLKNNRYGALQKNLERLKSNISIFELHKTLSSQEKEILKALKEELKVAEEKEKALNLKFREVASNTPTSSDRINDFYKTEKKYFMLKEQYNMATKRLTTLKAERAILIDKIARMEKNIEVSKPDIEYLKLLKEKELKLKILKSTVVADLSFDGIDKDTYRYKRASKIKTVFFAFVLSLFCVVIYLILRFLLDKKLYTDMEFKSEFSQFPIIGETPNMN